MYCQKYNKKNEQNLTDNELESLKELRMDRSIVILKADKGNCVVLLRRSDYNNDLEMMLQDESKFRLLKEDPTIKRENKLIQHLLKLKKDGDITEQFYKKVRPNGSQPARLYGLPKVHKNNHPLRPICSSVNAYNYKLASELASIISPYAVSDFSVKNTFKFVEEINQLSYPESFLCSFDVSSLFTMIPLDETIEITLDYVFENKEKVEGLSRTKFKKLLVMATKETNFIFNNKVYDQIDGVAMGSPLAPILANVFMRKFEENAILSYPGERPRYYRRYVDDSFLIFKSQNEVAPFFTYMNSLHPNIKFTMEKEANGTIAFLDVKVTKVHEKFQTNTESYNGGF